MALIKAKDGNSVYTWKSDDIRDGEINSLTASLSNKIQVTYIGDGVDSGENEHPAYFDFDNLAAGLYLCELISCNRPWSGDAYAYTLIYWNGVGISQPQYAPVVGWDSQPCFWSGAGQDHGDLPARLYAYSVSWGAWIRVFKITPDFTII